LPRSPNREKRTEIGFCGFTHTRRVGRRGDAATRPKNIALVSRRSFHKMVF
jgi:hypothetical protein